jgi:hypothetical protein
MENELIRATSLAKGKTTRQVPVEEPLHTVGLKVWHDDVHV